MADPLEIQVVGVGKRFHRWIFRDIHLHLRRGGRYGLIGHNGIGKSTFLRILSGFTTPSAGEVYYRRDGEKIDTQEAALCMAYAAPYIDLIAELTVEEMYQFHIRFCEMYAQAENIDLFLDRTQLRRTRESLVGDLSSGLMQRLKVGLAVLTDTPVLLLDEPGSYLDTEGKKWLFQLFQSLNPDRLSIIASNDPEDLTTCSEIIDMNAYVVRH